MKTEKGLPPGLKWLNLIAGKVTPPQKVSLKNLVSAGYVPLLASDLFRKEKDNHNTPMCRWLCVCVGGVSHPRVLERLRM